MLNHTALVATLVSLCGASPRGSIAAHDAFGYFVNTASTDWPKEILSFVGTAAGLLLGLFLNAQWEQHVARKTHREMRHTIGLEIEYNRNVKKDSVDEFFDQLSPERGVVLRDFDVSTTKQALANPLFVRYASAETLTTLNKYVRDIALSNAQRAALVHLIIDQPRKYRDWVNPLAENWRFTVETVKADFERIEPLCR